MKRITSAFILALLPYTPLLALDTLLNYPNDHRVEVATPSGTKFPGTVMLTSDGAGTVVPMASGHEGEPIVGVQKKFIYERGNVLSATTAEFIANHPQWVVTNTSGGTITTNASDQIIVTSGTDQGKVMMLHTTPLKGVLASKISMSLSQRIAGQRVQFGFESADNFNAAYIKLDSSGTASQAKCRYRSDNVLLESALYAITAASTTLQDYGVYNSDTAITCSDSAVGAQLTARHTATENLVNPDETYYLVFEVVNDTAVASSTTITIGNIVAELLTSYHSSTAITPRSSTTVLGHGMPVLVQNGSITTSGTISSLTGGSVAESAATATNPLPVGGRVRTTHVANTLVAGDMSGATFDINAALISKPYAIQALAWKYATPIATPITTATSVTLAAAGAAGIENYLTSIQMSNTGGTASVVSIKDGATVLWATKLPANMITPLAIMFPMPLQGTAATALNFVVETAGAEIFVNAQGYIGY